MAVEHRGLHRNNLIVIIMRSSMNTRTEALAQPADSPPQDLSGCAEAKPTITVGNRRVGIARVPTGVGPSAEPDEDGVVGP